MVALLRALAQAVHVNIAPTAVRTTTLTTSGFDVRDYDGTVIFILDGTGTAGTMDGKFQDSDTSGGTYADIPGATFTQIAQAQIQSKIAIDVAAAKGFVRFVGTSASSPSHTYCVNMIGFKKQGP